MKKIVLVSVLCGLVATPGFATRFQDTSDNCNLDAMMNQLNNATAENRAVITEIKCDTPSMMNGGDYFEYVEDVKMEQVTTSEVFVHQAKREQPKRVEQPMYRVQEQPMTRYVETVVYTYDCGDDDCCDCDDDCCDCGADEPVEEVKPIVVPAQRIDIEKIADSDLK